jgi:stearoyl-CoA desaturase (delta-9 desaturase)
MNIRTDNSPLKEKAPINWVVSIVLGLTFVITVTVVPWYGWVHGYSSWAWFFAALFLMLNGIGIGSGYHRLFSHRAYKAKAPLKVFFAIFGGMSLQNSILVWCARHRPHHRYVDNNEKDPYSIGRGFWFAHIGWMLRDYQSGEIDFSTCRDLEADPVVAWQHRYYWTLVWVTNLALPLFLGWLVGETLGVFLLAGVARLVVNHHVTFFINSLAHMWGSRPYTDEVSARDNWFLAIVTYGEGYHNFHHMFQNDYRNGVRWWHYDINKWFINVMAWLGQAHDMRRVPRFKILRARLSMEFKRAQQRAALGEVNSRWRERFEKEYDVFMDTAKRWQQLQTERVELGKRQLVERWEKTSLRQRYRELEKSLSMQRRRLALLTAQLTV